MSFFDLFRTPEHRFEHKITKVFEDAVDNACRNSGGNSMMAGVLVFHAISVAYDTLRKDENLRIASGKSSSEYQRYIENIMDKVGRKSLSNWDQMMRGRDRDEF